MAKRNINDMIYQNNTLNLGLISGFIDRGQDWRLEFSYNTNGQLEYVGESLQKIEKDEQGWTIRKLVYDGKGRIASFLWCKGNYIATWDNREDYTYGSKDYDVTDPGEL